MLFGGAAALFARNKVMALILAVTVASTMLLTSAVGLSSAFLIDYSTRILSSYSVDTVYAYLYDSTGSGASAVFQKALDKLGNRGDVERVYGAYIQVYRPAAETAFTVRDRNGTLLSGVLGGDSRIVFIADPGVSGTVLIVVGYRIGGGGAILDWYAYNRYSDPGITVYGDIECVLGGHVYDALPGLIIDDRFYSSISINHGGSGGREYWRLIFYQASMAAGSSLREAAASSSSLRGYIVYVVTTPNEIPVIVSRHRLRGPISLLIYADPSRPTDMASHRVPDGFADGVGARGLAPGPVSPYFEQLKLPPKTLSGNTMALLYVKYVAHRVIMGASSAASFSRYRGVVEDISRSLGGSAWPVADNVEKAIWQIRYIEGSIQFLFVISLLPSLIVVWIAASRTPPAIISIMRKTIALLRIRGVGITRIKNGFLASSLLWGFAGAAAGALLGPLAVSLITGYEYPVVLETVIDPATVALVVAVTLVAIIVSVNSGFKAISGVAPREFTVPTIFAELPLTKRGMGFWGWLLLALGAYYVMRSLSGISPATLLPMARSPAISILLIILALLEPIVVFFGPVILVYAVAKTITAYPEQLAGIVEALVRPFAKEYRHVAGKLVLAKPERIALIILLTSFSISLLLAGVVGSESSRVTFENMVDTALGPRHTYYMILDARSSSQVEEAVENITGALRGHSYTVTVLVQARSDGYGGLRPYTILFEAGENALPASYILVLRDKESYIRVMRLHAELGIGVNGVDAVRALGRGDFVYVVPARQIRALAPILSRRHVYNATLYTPGSSSGTVIYGGMVLRGGLRNLPGVYTIGKSSDISEYIGVRDYYDRIDIWGSTGIILVSSAPGAIVGWDTGMTLIDRVAEKIGDRIRVAILVHSDEDLGGLLKGFAEIDVSEERAYFEGGKSFFSASFALNTATGAALTASTLIALATLTFITVEENVFSYTLMRARGIGKRRVFRVAVGESLASVMIGMIPGVLLGLLLGATITTIFFSLITSPASSANALVTIGTLYGITIIFSITPLTLAAIAAVPLLVASIPLVIVWWMYGRVLREAIVLLGSHV